LLNHLQLLHLQELSVLMGVILLVVAVVEYMLFPVQQAPEDLVEVEVVEILETLVWEVMEHIQPVEVVVELEFQLLRLGVMVVQVS